MKTMFPFAPSAVRALLALNAALSLCACEDKKAEPAMVTATAAAPIAPAPVAAAPAKATAPAAAAAGPPQSIKGIVSFTGTPPVPSKLNRAADPICARTPMNDESILVNANKTLKNVVVRISSDITAPTPTTTAKLEIQQKDCMYRPRVSAIVAGQTIVVKNGDETLHNVHTYKGTTTLFNLAQPAGSPSVEKTVKENLAIVKLKCDVHPWMTGFVSVTNHPYFAVTGDDGSFEIKDVPQGHYKLEAWHEKLGSKVAELTVAGSAVENNFSYDGTEK